MLKRLITYTDFNDEEITEEFYFNISKTEIVQLEASSFGGFSAWIQGIIKAEDITTLMQQFERIILLSYGEKSPDGKHFVKNDENKARFKSSAAYDSLFWEIFQDEEKMASFITAVVPKEASDNARAEIENTQALVTLVPPTPPST